MVKTEERFWAKVNKTDACWEWTAASQPKGYGRFKVNGRLVGAHRFSYELHYGPIPEGLWVLHRCDNPKCVNPEHLFLGTRSDNMFDCARKDRLAVHNAPLGERHPRAKLMNKDILDIRQSYREGCIQKELALGYGVSRQLISQVVTRRIWKHVGETNDKGN